jgi:hypothetical protein
MRQRRGRSGGSSIVSIVSTKMFACLRFVVVNNRRMMKYFSRRPMAIHPLSFGGRGLFTE